jgi:hypothetical protein
MVKLSKRYKKIRNVRKYRTKRGGKGKTHSRRTSLKTPKRDTSIRGNKRGLDKQIMLLMLKFPIRDLASYVNATTTPDLRKKIAAHILSLTNQPPHNQYVNKLMDAISNSEEMTDNKLIMIENAFSPLLNERSSKLAGGATPTPPQNAEEARNSPNQSLQATRSFTEEMNGLLAASRTAAENAAISAAISVASIMVRGVVMGAATAMFTVARDLTENSIRAGMRQINEIENNENMPPVVRQNVRRAVGACVFGVMTYCASNFDRRAHFLYHGF